MKHRDSIDWTRLPRQIELVYEAAADRSQWKTFVDDVSATLGTTGGNVHLRAPQGQVHYTEHTLITVDQLARYNTEMIPYDYWNAAINALPQGAIFGTRDGYCGSPREFTQTKFYREWVVDTPMFFGVGGSFVRQGDRVGVVGFFRAESDGELPPESKSYVQSLVPHLKHAFRIQEHIDQLQSEIATLRQHFEHRGVGQLLLDDHGRVLFCDSTARSFLRRGGLRISAGSLWAEFASQQTHLDACVARAVSGEAAADSVIALHRSKHRTPLFATFSPFRSDGIGDLLSARPRVLVHLRDPEDFDHIDQARLRELFSLTERESQLAMHLVRGESLAAYALANDVTKATARVHMKSLFRKLDVHSQHQLVSTLLNTLR